MALLTGAHQNVITASRIPPLVADPHFANVVALIGFDEAADGATSAVDDSPIGNTLTFSGGSVEVDDAQSRFGYRSAVWTANSYISIPDQVGVSIDNANDMTFECWIRTTDNTQLQSIFNKRASSSAQEGTMFINGGVMDYRTYVSGATSTQLTGTTSVSDDEWHHVAACRASGVWYLFLDGGLEDSVSEVATPSGNAEPMHMGNSAFNTARWMRGWIDEIRITANVARYTAAFSRPTARFPRF